MVGYVAPKLLGDGPAALVGAGITTIAEAIELDLTDITQIGPDLRFTALQPRPPKERLSMFTGIVEELGEVVHRHRRGRRLGA